MNNTEITINFQTVSTAELESKLIKGEKFEFWNVLTAEYYSGENIAGSRHVALDSIGREIANSRLPVETEIVVYCANPHCPQSNLAAEKLLTYGYKNVKTYKGGLEEWEAAGLAIEPDETSVSAAQSGAISCH